MPQGRNRRHTRAELTDFRVSIASRRPSRFLLHVTPEPSFALSQDNQKLGSRLRAAQSAADSCRTSRLRRVGTLGFFSDGRCLASNSALAADRNSTIRPTGLPARTHNSCAYSRILCSGVSFMVCFLLEAHSKKAPNAQPSQCEAKKLPISRFGHATNRPARKRRTREGRRPSSALGRSGKFGPTAKPGGRRAKELRVVGQLVSSLRSRHLSRLSRRKLCDERIGRAGHRTAGVYVERVDRDHEPDVARRRKGDVDNIPCNPPAF